MVKAPYRHAERWGMGGGVPLLNPPLRPKIIVVSGNGQNRVGR